MFSKLLRRFLVHQDGSVAIIFAAALLVVVFAAGVAIEYSRASMLRSRIQAANDAAVILLCQSPSTLTAEQLATKAQRVLDSFNFAVPVTARTPIVTPSPRQIELQVQASYTSSVVKQLGHVELPIGTSSSCMVGERFFEVALVLDTTGSMSRADGGVSKMDSLKVAARNFVDHLFDTVGVGGKLKMSIVPFAAAVSVDPANRTAWYIDSTAQSSFHWANVNDPNGSGFYSRFDIFNKLKTLFADFDWGGCFESPTYPANVRDGKPTASAPDTLYVPMFAPDELGDGGGSSSSWFWDDRKKTANSYLDDSNWFFGCSLPAGDVARVGQACKYKYPKSASTTGLLGPNFACTVRPLTRLTTNRTTLLNEIGALAAAGNTNIHEGLMWGWRTLSPLSIFADGSAYTKTDTSKVLVLMTDGVNTWGDNDWVVFESLYSAYGYYRNIDGSNPNSRLPPAHAGPHSETAGRAAMDALTREACANARAAGVTIYTIGFSIASDPIDAQGRQLLEDCAGSSERYFLASNATGLNAAFDAIAQGLGKLRLLK